MEPEAAVRLWSRSEQLGYRYVTFVGDGDSASFNAVTALNDGDGPYSVPVVKEKCVNHMAKRLGTRLRRLKDSLKIPTQTKGGKTVHRSALAGKKGLPDSVIDKPEYSEIPSYWPGGRPTQQHLVQLLSCHLHRC